MPIYRPIAAAWAIVGLVTWAAAAAQSAAQQRLAAATRLECRFAALATGTWSDEDGTASIAVAPVEFEVIFNNIDVERGTAEAEGRVGTSYIVARYTGDMLHLVQTIDIGPVYLTTVFAEETSGGRLRAVHTRHEFAASSYPEFRERPEMYIGDCMLARE